MKKEKMVVWGRGESLRELKKRIEKLTEKHEFIFFYILPETGDGGFCGDGGLYTHVRAKSILARKIEEQLHDGTKIEKLS